MLPLLALLQSAEPEPSVFNLSTNVSFWTVVIFLVLLFILGKFAYPPILGYAAAREKRIQESLDEAQHQREEALRLLEEQRAELVRARLEAQGFIAEGKQAAERIRQDMLEQARKEQEDILARAREEIGRERDQTIEALRREAVDLSLAAASKLIGQKLDAENDRRIVREYLSQVAVAPAPRPGA
jgi:F-type H+-transporting ATPase subunit b